MKASCALPCSSLGQGLVFIAGDNRLIVVHWKACFLLEWGDFICSECCLP